MPHCTSCGREVDGGAAFCEHCGESLAGNSDGRTRGGGLPTEGGDGGRSTLKQVGYYSGRLVQLGLVSVGIILIVGSILGNMNISAFTSIGIFVLILFALVGVTEWIVIRPLS